MVGEPQVVVAAERQVFAPVHHDARSLRAFARDAAAHKAAALDFGELVGKTLKDQERIVRCEAARLMLGV
jgi:hypothetical protein